MKKNIAIIGAGSWGIALGLQLHNSGHKVDFWTKFEKEALEFNQNKKMEKYLPDIEIPSNIICYTDIKEVMANKELIVLAVPSQAIRSVARDIAGLVNENNIIVSVAKGIEEGSLMRMSEVINDEIPNCKLAIFSGPSHAEEVARNIPTTIVASSIDSSVAEQVQDIFMTDSLRVYTNSDLVGVELGSALKNIIALSTGIIDGLGFGDNTKAALMSRGLVEMSRLGEAMGAKKETFIGLTGLGDLIVTCTSVHSRNRRAGKLIGQGKTIEESVNEVKMVVEGITVTKAAYELAKRYNVEMPIVEQAYKTLFENKDPRQAVIDLMQRDKKEEAFL